MHLDATNDLLSCQLLAHLHNLTNPGDDHSGLSLGAELFLAGHETDEL